MAATAGSDARILEPSLFRGNAAAAMRNYETRANVPTRQIPISDSIKQDNREVNSLAERILKSTNPDEQTRYQNQFTWELARHYVGEELVVYPALEKHVEGGKDLAERNRREHQGVGLPIHIYLI